MNITTKEAQVALESIQHRITATRNIRNWWAYLLLVCGAYWTICFLLWQIIFSFMLLQTTLFWFTMVMFGFIIIGMEFQDHSLIGPGVNVTLMSAPAYSLLSTHNWQRATTFVGLPFISACIYFPRQR